MAWSDIDRVGVDGAVEVPTSSDAPTGTVVPATAPDGATHSYTIEYRVSHAHAATGLTAVDAGHNHPHTATHAHQS
jgi:hypothetical protein